MGFGDDGAAAGAGRYLGTDRSAGRVDQVADERAVSAISLAELHYGVAAATAHHRRELGGIGAVAAHYIQPVTDRGRRDLQIHAPRARVAVRAAHGSGQRPTELRDLGVEDQHLVQLGDQLHPAPTGELLHHIGHDLGPR